VTRRVYFSFHYDNDNWRANQVRNSWMLKPDRQSAGFWDHAEWEQVKRGSDPEIKQWINRQMEGSSVTCVLIGSDTCTRKWVRYEVQRSIEEGKGVIGIRIHNCKDKEGNTCAPGDTDFGLFNGKTFDELFPTYDWADDDGYNNLGDWVEQAAQVAGRLDLEPPASKPRKYSQCLR